MNSGGRNSRYKISPLTWWWVWSTEYCSYLWLGCTHFPWCWCGIWAQLKQHTLIRVWGLHPTPTTCAFIFLSITTCRPCNSSIFLYSPQTQIQWTPHSCKHQLRSFCLHNLFHSCFGWLKKPLWKSLTRVHFCKMDCLIFQTYSNHKVLKVSSEKWIQIPFVCPHSGSHTNCESILEARVGPLSPNKIDMLL